MALRVRGLWATLVLLVLFGSLVPSVDAKVPVVWARRRVPSNCEPPRVFYSNQHVAGRYPCCPTIEGICGGGGVCPASGICPGDGKPCQAEAVVDRPNIILFISDDQGYCHYGNAEECRSSQSGTPIPVPKTPNLDLLAGHGTVFPIAHNTASWCFPALASILTARYQKDFHGERKVLASIFSMIPGALRNLETDPTAQNDPYNAGNKVGGYCTLLAGKFTGSLDQTSFDAVARTSGRKLGRNACVATGGGQPPLCGAESAGAYAPFTVGNMTDVFNFLDMLTYAQPGSDPKQYAMQHFFVWYAPRIPHEPLRPPMPVMDYLFGAFGSFPLGGVMDLGQWCTGASCAPVVAAFNENNFGTVRDYYGNLWWVDENVRELRKFLAMETAPHCFGPDGHSRFEVGSEAQCAPGAWSGVTPDLGRNTVILYLSDNGWQLPSSKHAFTENGIRTQVLVFDPRTEATPPSWDVTQETIPPARKSDALAHGIDMLPTALGYALGTPGGQPCPVGPDGVTCDGHDLRPYLVDAPGGPAAPETLRHAICGHQTKRPTTPTRNRYLLTRPGTVGRCTNTANATCTTSLDCGAGQFCLGGYCALDSDGTPCSNTATCPAGAVCLGNHCRMAPACLDDSDCAALLGAGYACTAKEQKWCRNDPDAACSSSADCPPCPAVNGNPVPCGRLCEARSLKLYVEPGSIAAVQLSDLFLDPDERGLQQGNTASLTTDLSKVNGPYGGAMRRMNCCVDEWWPEIVSQVGTLCQAGDSCPADLTCDQ